MNRLYHNYLLPDKSEDYRKLLVFLKDMEYEFHTVRSFEKVVAKGTAKADGMKYCILRRDVDTQNKKVLSEMLEIEKEIGARCSYYFRLRTLDVPTMKRIEADGGEASYHFEEISDYIIKHHLRSKEKIYADMDKIQESFKENLVRIRNATGLPCITVASHGEWPNRRLRIRNMELMSEQLRRETGIIREAYDEEAMNLVDARFADQGNDNFISEIIGTVKEEHPGIIYILTHPAQWRADFVGSLKLDFRRIADEIFYRF